MSLRREFFVGLCTALVWPLAARAQKVTPVIGYLTLLLEPKSESFSDFALAIFRVGLLGADHRQD